MAEQPLVRPVIVVHAWLHTLPKRLREVRVASIGFPVVRCGGCDPSVHNVRWHMDYSYTQGLVDCHGRPVEARIARAIGRLLPRLLRHFPALRDDTLLTDVVDRAGRRLATREERMGTIERLDGYTWATLRTIATSVLRQGSARLVQNTLQGIRGERQLSVLACTSGAPEDIERAILLQEVLQMLPPDERHIVLCKLAGLSSLEIAKLQARSVSAINTSLCRAKKKLRKVLQQSSTLDP